MLARQRVLVVEDDDNFRQVMHAQLSKEGYETESALDVPEALKILEKSPQQLVIADLNLPGASGLDLLRKIQANSPGTAVIMMTAFGNIQSAVEAMKAGASDYLVKPIYPYELKALVNKTLDHRRSEKKEPATTGTLGDMYGFEHIVGSSGSLWKALEVARRVAETDATVLIHGETGTGKELIANAIHVRSDRRDRPFMTINCAAIPRELLESELFGFVKGSFTGALSHKIGKVEMADGGTLLLDEIGEMPPDLQVRILRLIQSKEIEKVGAKLPTKVDVRIVAATHRDLVAMVKDGRFREDLYYRLLVVPIEVPPIREREGDIRQLVDHFFSKFKAKYHRPDLKMADNLLPYFMNYSWPGNVRQLENVIERMALLCPGPEVDFEELPEILRLERSEVATTQTDLPDEGFSLSAVEKDLIVRVLRKFSGNQTSAARYLGLSRRTLSYRIKKYSLCPNY